ncbi:hypothetical protein C8E99_0928 [Citricoccus muralis]|uniref:Uncharacterized protein n=1 Tax=Citricoccus muralis TaxID=169134 RepID=A0A3D9LBU1_9MICC|nr:hypothetical protein C8E99_0928 [Citricoccus muralis]
MWVATNGFPVQTEERHQKQPSLRLNQTILPILAPRLLEMHNHQRRVLRTKTPY